MIKLSRYLHKQQQFVQASLGRCKGKMISHKSLLKKVKEKSKIHFYNMKIWLFKDCQYRC